MNKEQTINKILEMMNEAGVTEYDINDATYYYATLERLGLILDIGKDEKVIDWGCLFQYID